ncbi:hypothetical protein D3C87_1592220 [compost metagenome]
MLDRRAIGNTVLQRQDHQVTGRHLRDLAVIDLFVTLVLDGDRSKRPILVDRDRVRLAAEIAGRLDRLRGNVDGGEEAGRLGEAFARIDRDQRLGTGNGHRRRLAVEGNDAGRLRRLGIGDIDEADALARAIGIDQRAAVFCSGDDFRRCRFLAGIALRQIVGNGEGRNTIEHRLGGGRKSDGREKYGGKRRSA